MIQSSIILDNIERYSSIVDLVDMVGRGLALYKFLFETCCISYCYLLCRIFQEYRGSDWLKCLPSESFLATAIKCHINQKKLYLDSDLFLLQSPRETSQAVEVGRFVFTLSLSNLLSLSFCEKVSNLNHKFYKWFVGLIMPCQTINIFYCY